MQTIDIFPYIKNLSIRDIKFINWPFFYDRVNYERSIEKVVDYLSKCEEISAIYQIGDIGVPGISDIDLIIVFKDDVKSFQQSYRKLFNKHDVYLFMHGIYGMPENIFERRELLIPIYKTKVLMGHVIDEKKVLDEAERKILKRIYALEYLLINLSNLTSQFIQRELKIRNIMCSLYALNYDFEILSNGELEDDEKLFVREINNLRNSWWEVELHHTDELLQIFKKAVELIIKALKRFSQNKEWTISPENGPSYICIGANRYLKANCRSSEIRIEIIKRSPLSLVNRLGELPISVGLRKQFRDISNLFFATILTIPHQLFSIIDGGRENGYASIFKKRELLLLDYYRFMKNISYEYTVYDTLRWGLRQNTKWVTIHKINNYLFTAGFKEI